MIKAIAGNGKNRLLIFGLSAGNIERLKKGQPIDIDLTEMGLEGRAVIFAGETEATMAADLSEMIGPQTKVRGMRQ